MSKADRFHPRCRRQSPPRIRNRRKQHRIVTVNRDPDVNFEPLPGYRLIERLGSGGYGEVWRAEAPGGLTKAIKFVFGRHDEKRASIELRALNHVRGVR